ncbi:MAG TPA: hypothetical protein V6D05_14965 [Stenomitos sp.]
MKRYLPAALAVMLAGCTSLGLPTTPVGPGTVNNSSGLTTVAPLSPSEAALKTKEGLASLNSAIASLRDLKGSSSVSPRGSAADLQQAAAYHLYKALSTETEADDYLPDDSYNEVEWFHEVVGEPTLQETETEYVLTEHVTEEGRVNGVAVEHYETTVTTRIPRSGGYTPSTGADETADYDDYVGDWGAQGGTYTRDEVVTQSEFRKLGHYVTTGTMTLNGDKPLIQATQDFTPKGETKTYHLTFGTSFSDSTMTFEVKGDAPGGGSLDLKSTAGFTLNGGTSSATFTQQGSIVTAKGETILVDCSMAMTTSVSEQGSTMSAKGDLSLNFKDKLVLKFTMDQSNTEDKSTGAVYAADGTTKMGTIAMSASNPQGTVTFNDGTTQSINMQTIADLMNIAQSVSI